MKNQLHESMTNTFREALKLSVAKNHDYAGDDDPYKNFRLVEFLGVASVETAILVRLCDKMSRISSLADKTERVEDETYDDTLLDIINYAAILRAYKQNKKT